MTTNTDRLDAITAFEHLSQRAVLSRTRTTMRALELFNLATTVIDAVTKSTDSEADFYDGQSAVEDWALDALWAVRDGDLDKARALIDRFDAADWHPECDGENDTGVYRALYEPWQHGEGYHDERPSPNCVHCPLPTAAAA